MSNVDEIVTTTTCAARLCSKIELGERALGLLRRDSDDDPMRDALALELLAARLQLAVLTRQVVGGEARQDR